MEKVKAKLIIEIMGRPAEHLFKALNELVDKLGTEKGISFINKSLNEPKAIEKAPGFFTSFADLEMEFDSLNHFFNIVFNYMPAHVEIYEPEKFKVEAFSLNEIANYIVSRLHRNEGIMKTLMGEREILMKQLEHIKNGGKIEDLYPKQEVKKQADGKKTHKKSAKKPKAKKGKKK